MSLVSPCADHLSKKRIRMVELGSLYISKGFPHSLIGKEPACSAGDPSSIPGSGRSAGEGISYPLQCSWTSLVAQLVKNLPAMWETWVRSLGWEVFWPEEFHGLYSP